MHSFRCFEEARRLIEDPTALTGSDLDEIAHAFEEKDPEFIKPDMALHSYAEILREKKAKLLENKVLASRTGIALPIIDIANLGATVEVCCAEHVINLVWLDQLNHWMFEHVRGECDCIPEDDDAREELEEKLDALAEEQT